MATYDLTIPSDQFGPTTINVADGDVVNIPAGMRGDIIINGGPNITVNVLGDPDGGSDYGSIIFGNNTEPTLNIPTGTDYSRYDIQANGESLTLNMGDGSTIGNIDATGLDNTGTFTINAGNNVTIDGPIDNYGADAVFTFGSGATFNGNVIATSVGSADVTIGDNADVNGSFNASSGDNVDVNVTFGDNLQMVGPLNVLSSGGDKNLTIGDGATINNAINMAAGTNTPANLTIGNDVTLLGNINTGDAGDTVVIGDNWNLANVNLGLGDDNITIGMQAESSGTTNIDGGNPQGTDVDGITITARPDQVAAFTNAGWVDNGDGTFSSPPASFNGSPVYAPGVNAYDFEGAAAPLPNDPPVIDPIADTTTPENSTDPVFTASATDPDGDPVTYSLSGDDAALFNIDPTTGEVTPIAGLDFENPTDTNGDGVYDITVVATDPDGATAEEPVAITVGDVNEAPVLDPITDPTIPENSTDPVFTASATDPDGDQPVYSLTGDDAALFTIDPATGEVTPIAGLDAENPTDANGDGVYDITVVATDPNDPTLFDEEPVAITVGDVNEAPVLDPITDPTIPENSTDPVFTASATDPDGDQPVYSLTGDDAALFTIDPATGEVTPIAPLDFENPTDTNGDGVYDITVVATDPNDPTLFDEEPVAITVGDVNETSTIVDGENFAELMTPGYSDGNTPTDSGGDIIDGADGDNDTILGNGGDDTINAGLGTDEVYGGSGNDVIDGGAGNDTITGDFADGVSDVVVDSGTQAGDDSLSGGSGDDVIYGDSGDGNGVTTPADTTNTSTGVDYQVIYLDWFGTDLDPTETGGTLSSFSENGGLINGATYGSSGNPLSANIVTMFAGTGNGDGQYDGDNTVSNETFTISNNPGTTFTFDGSAVYENTIVTYEDGTTATVSAVVFQSTSGDLFLAPEFSNNADTSVYTAQPITSIQLGTQDTSAGLGNGLSLERILDSWVAFSEQTSPSDGGNDTLAGGEGADTMYGEGGDDTFLVGSAAEGAGDVITGGNGPDENTDNDILDLRGAGNVTINQSADVNDAGATTGTVTFSDGSTLQFSQIEQILTDPPNSAPVLDPIGAQSFDENDTGAVFTASATDPDGDAVTYSLTGPDAALFNIDPTTGEVTPVNPLDFENPTDAGGDNVYNITVVATDPSGLSDQEDVAITVADLNEPDGVVDGEATGESMAPGYNDNNAPTDGGGDTIGAGDDSIDGNGGDDTIDAGAGNDTVDGGADDDSITGGDGDDSVLGGDGSDTLAGGEGTDTLDGGAGDDDIAVGGDDTGLGGSGDDVFTIDPTDPATNIDVTIDGGTDGTDGNPDGPENGDEGDVLDLSGEANDLTVDFLADPEDGTVNGLDADGFADIQFQEIEKVLTGTGDDSIDGGSSTGPIDVETGGGDDTVAGGTGDDTIDGGDDNDSIDGGDGDDSIAGGAGTDTLTGGLGNDTLDGGDGDDDLVLGSGDTGLGGGGDDEFILDPTNTDGPGTITIDGGADATSGSPADTANGDAGDTLDFTGLDNVTIVTPLVDDGTGSFSGQVSYTNDEGEVITVDFTEIENVLGLPAGPDGVVDGEATGESMAPGYNDNNAPTDGGGDTIGAGDDSIDGNGGDDTIDAGAGNDTVDGGADDDSITGGDGDDSVLGGDGADTLAGGEGTDTLDGGAGDDDIAVGGDDTGLGGSGDDVFTIDPTDPAPDVAVTIDGGTDGTVPGEEAGPENGDEGDVLDLSDETGDLDVVLEADPESGTVDGIDTIAGDDDITFDEIEKVLTGTGNDSIDGGGSTGPIDVETGGGDDTVAGGTGDDTIDGGDDDDSIDGGDGDDSIAGGAGTDTLTGGLGADTIDGGAGDDDITVGAGDVATGGSGDDDFFLDPTNTDGPDTITIDGGSDATSGAPDDLANGDDGDTLNFTGLTNVTIVTPLVDDGTGSFSGVVSYENDEGETVTVDFTEIENVLGLPGGPDGVVDGEATGELMDVGYDDANAPTDGGGDLITENPDSIEGNGGDDTINGGGGNDTIDGGDDDDVIDGGLGDDSVLGGDGADSVVGGDGADTIYGGSNVPADNLIDDNIDPGQNDPDTLNGQDTLDGGAGNDVIFGEDDDDSITGGTGNDSLDGGIDDDTLSGGDGEDTLIGGQGADSMSGGLGDDTFLVGTFDDPNNPGDSYIEGIGDTIVGGEDPGDTDTDTLDLTGSGPLTVIPSAPGAEDGIVEFYSDPAKTNLIGTLAYSEIENIIPCFTPGTLIATMKGEVPVESLQEGDKVITRDNGIQEIRWIGKRTLQRDELRRAPHLSPILIKAGSLGDGLPERDMMVSPQHRMLVAGDQTQLYFEEPEVLVAAKHLINNGSIQAIDTLRATYIHFMFDQHEVVLADGAWTESFQPGDQTLGAMGTAQRNEILELFPDLEMQTGRDDYVAARRVLKGYEAKLLKG